MPGNYTLRKTYVDGDILSASDYVADHQQHIDNQTPQGTDDYSANVTQYRTNTDTGNDGTESLPSTLAGEIERLRFAIKEIKTKLNASAVTQWYTKSYSVVIGNSSVTAAKLADGATHIQYLRTQSADVVVGLVDTILVSQLITRTRTRIRIRGVSHMLGLKIAGGNTTVTLTLKRSGTIIATQNFDFPTDGTGEFSATGVIDFLDISTVGAFTYTLEAIKSNGSTTITINDNVLVLEEVA